MTRVRPTLLKLHRWLGIGLAVLLLVQGLTGAALAFRHELDALLHPALKVSPAPARAPVQALIDTVRAAHPDHDFNRVDFPGEADRAAVFTLARKTDDQARLVAVDPYANRIVRDGTVGDWPTEWLFHLHEELLAGETGHTIVGIEGLALLFLAITGPIVWWPGIARLRKSLRVVVGRGADPLWRTLHRTGGAIAAAFLLISATTGALMVWKVPLRDALAPYGTIKKPAPKVAEQPGRAMLAADRLIARARADHGDTPLQQLRFPGGHGRVVTVYLDSDPGTRPGGSKQIWYDAYSGDELGRYVTGSIPAGNAFIDWLYTIHTGAVAGTPGRLLVLLAGLSLAALSGSGVWLWWSRTARLRARRGSRAAPETTAGAGATSS